jgi:anhydro-N-acetylmuramic acid kinase
MNNLEKLIRKKEKKVIGVLSGTSVDSVSIVLVNIRGKGEKSKIKVIDFQSFNIDKRLKNHILKNSNISSSSVEEICKLNFIIGSLFASSVNKFLRKRKISNSDIDLIGSHGQTIYHIPEEENLFGFRIKSTMQIGEPSVIANSTGITTVADFRTADVAVKGDGAPLIPYLDYILFSCKNKSRILLNIGGIANFTFLKRNCTPEDIIAFDSGPGNMLIDNAMRYYFNRDFDKNGGVAQKGKFNKKLFEEICSKDIYYKRKPPKSTGREYYEAVIFKFIIDKFNKIPPEDIVKTLTVYTAFTIAYNINNFLPTEAINSEILISGGGSKNLCILKILQELLPCFKLKILDDNGINAENKEAILFAVLANEAVSGNKANVRTATNAIKSVILGKICPV